MTLIEKTLGQPQKGWDREFFERFGANKIWVTPSKENVETIHEIWAFITQALQEQDRESRRVLAEEIEKLLNKNCEGDVYTDSITEEVIALIKQDEN